MYGFPEDPIINIDYSGTIYFEDGASLTQSQHQMTSGAMSLLGDLLKWNNNGKSTYLIFKKQSKIIIKFYEASVFKIERLFNIQCC